MPAIRLVLVAFTGVGHEHPPCPPLTRRFQFSLRAMLAVTTLIAAPLGLWCQRIASQNAVIAMIKAKGGTVIYGDMKENSSSPAWLGPFDGDRVQIVILAGDRFSDEDLPRLSVFPGIIMAAIRDETKVTKAGMLSLRQQLPHCIVRPYRTFFQSEGMSPSRFYSE